MSFFKIFLTIQVTWRYESKFLPLSTSGNLVLRMKIVVQLSTLGGGFKYFFTFHPENWGNDPI